MMTKLYSIGNSLRRKAVTLDENTLMTKRLKKLAPRLRELVSMLEYARPANSQTEEEFITRYIDTLPNVQCDAFGNRYVTVGREKPIVAWSSHTDTVHWEEGKQALMLDGDGNLCLDAFSEASCLGADCTAGVWLMRRLILAGKPGLYIFHRSEESGGLGSKWIASNTPELVSGIDIMIALDRRGYDSVITDQSTGNTASKAFALSLAAQLGQRYKPDPTGVFTDSAFYSRLIPECTNVSVGYFDQHTRGETLDHVFLDDLLISLLRLDYEKLQVSRDHTATEEETWGSYRYQYDGIGLPDADTDMTELIRRHPEAVAMLLRQWDIGEADLYDAIDEYEMEENYRQDFR